jgi:predicted Zn-dependent peptidase
MKHTKNTWLLRPALALAVVLTFVAPMLAQAPQLPGAARQPISPSKVERKNKAPVSKEILQVKLPKPYKTTLANGIRVLIMEDHRFPLVTASMQIRGAGPIHEPANMPGLASITAEMMREGTKTRTSKQLAEQLDELGASATAMSGFGSVSAVVSGSGLSDNLDEWFPILADVLLNPTFPKDELDKLKARLKIRLKQQRSMPYFLANERFSRAVYGDHPAAVVSATAESIDAFTPEALAKWHAEHYCPQNTILGIAGDVKPAEMVAKLNQWLDAWKKTDFKPEMPPNPVAADARKVYLVDRPNSVQTTLSLGNIGINRLDPDYMTMTLMNKVIGGGTTGRFFMNLREEHGYTYGAYSGFSATWYPGAWSGSADVRTEVTDGALTEFFKELKRIGTEPVPAGELDDAKRALVASFALSLESPNSLLSYAVQSEIYGLPADYWDTYPTRMMAVTAADVQQVGAKYLNPDAIQVIAVGDGSKIKAILDKYGPVQTYNVEGKPVAAPQPSAGGH